MEFAQNVSDDGALEESRKANEVEVFVGNVQNNISKCDELHYQEATSKCEAESNEDVYDCCAVHENEQPVQGLVHCTMSSSSGSSELKWTTHRIYVGNLPNNITKECIRRLFAKYCPRHLQRVQCGKKCFAFLDLGDAENVVLAIKELNYTMFQGRRLIVSEMKRNSASKDFSCATEKIQGDQSSFDIENNKEENYWGPSSSFGMDYAGDASDVPSGIPCSQCQGMAQSEEEVCLKYILAQQSRNLQLEEKKLLLEIEKLQLEIKKLTRENSFFTCRA
ncbi:hypothetical protein NDU88_006233 [Pleurodeles waltl]|uniref:RRM domain-containing protein n=1 Tax=Pleurodeles waltl TaxID=8319 RepID=A0AAV7QL55_PLEWA|nr:hypothetical protein NDU88_006233 [Pleurodeles waltl]